MAASTAWIGRGVYRLGHLQVDMDEALHANRGLDFTSAFLRGDWQDAWQNFTKPEWYPPGHGILLGAWFLVTGASIETARLYSTLFYFLFGLLLWLSTRELIPSADPFVYLIPTLFLIADALHTVYAGLSMLELPAITFGFAALFFLNRAWRENRFVDHLLVLIFTFLCLFTKYNYGLVVVIVLAVCYSVMLWRWLRSGDNSVKLRTIMTAWIPFALVMGIWFVGLGQWRWLFDYASAQPARYGLWSQTNLWYYPRLLWNHSLNWLAVVLTLAGAIALFKQWRMLRGLFAYLIFFGISLFMLTVELENTPRFGMMLFPPLWITAAVGAWWIIDRFHPRWLRVASTVGLLAFMLLTGLGNFRSFMSTLFAEHENANAGVNEAYDFVAQALDIEHNNELKVVMIGRSDQWNGPALHFHLESKCTQPGMDCQISAVDTREIRRGWPEQEFAEEIQVQRLADTIDQADYIIHFFKQPEQPVGWEPVAEREFTFERQNKKPSLIWVSIYKH
jgi:hypothetical protein